PMTEAIRRAAAELKYTESKASVILVSDGEETCDADPCAAATQLEQAGVDLTVHTVGFDVVEKKGKDQLRCLAENTGGRFVLAEDAPSLKKAIAEAVQVAAAKEPPPPPPTATAEPEPTPAPQAQATAPKQNFLPRGGHGYEDAVALEPGDYVVNWEVKANVFEHWKIEGRAGQLVKIDLVTTPEAGYTGGFLASADKQPLTREGCTNRTSSLQWLPSSTEEIYTYVFALGGCNGIAKGSGVVVSLVGKYDAGTSTDVGDAFDGALEVKPGIVEGFLTGSWGDDDKDYYRLRPITAGTEIKVKVVPPTELGYRLRLYDQDRVEVAEKQSANAGAIARLAWTAKEDQEEIFLLIELHQKPQDLPFAPYRADVEVKAAPIGTSGGSS
ncbi:MAG: vWA domain-containing protein, partial [Candidatus Binatia bacterium]